MTDAVSRETPPAPAWAAGVFSSALPRVERYAELLTVEGTLRGLIGPREVPRLWERHLGNCAVLGEAFAAGTEVADVGTGAGLPGIVLALVRTDLSVVLVEPLLRRATFLSEVVETMGLSNVEVVRARAEDLHGSREFPAVTARAVARLDKLAGWTLPLVAVGGDLVAMKGGAAADEVQEARPAIRRLGGEVVGVEQYGAGLVADPTTAVRVRVVHRSARGSGPARSARNQRRRGSDRR